MRKWGHRSGGKPRKKNWGSCPSTFFGSESTISRFGKLFRNGQYSLVSFLFSVLLLTGAPVPKMVKVGTRAPPCPMESAPLFDDRPGELVL